MARGGGSGGQVLIAVIGVTGAGKTTFISRATGRTDLVVGHGIDSCTQDVTPIQFGLGGKAITLIDTPGFDDSERTDADILGLVAAYMAKTYEQGMLLHGIIFLQPINQPRLQGSEKRRTRLFKKLLGENAYQRVVVATTMWNQVSESEGRQRQNERESRPDVWGDMVSRGARVVRHNDDQSSATSIISSLTQFSAPITLQIQKELVENGGRVAATSAGRQLDEDLGETIVKLRKEIEALARERSNTAEEMRELREKIRQLERERQDLDESNVWLILACAVRDIIVVGGTIVQTCVIL